MSCFRLREKHQSTFTPYDASFLRGRIGGYKFNSAGDRFMKPTPGKLAGLKAVSDARGVIDAAAMDQRGSLQKALAKERGPAADAHDLEVFKEMVTDVLTQHASAILLDPEFGLPASKLRHD